AKLTSLTRLNSENGCLRPEMTPVCGTLGSVEEAILASRLVQIQLRADRTVERRIFLLDARQVALRGVGFDAQRGGDFTQFETGGVQHQGSLLLDTQGRTSRVARDNRGQLMRHPFLASQHR